MNSEVVRVLRVVEYVGDREWVEWQVAHSIQGEKEVDSTLSNNPHGKGIIKAATIGIYPEILK